ncbi:heme ABC transporter ATP-binding protein [Rhodovibrio salinarum]|uniref:Heme ABC transporter ATP-binding protein n=2 Tax=Rhodovibrio salinarum TaxID=1087 RepID=A0A934QJG9_9PROT|nr:heme ABC transporter ATP-binding protein [Rhodovibrio salinarum]MBK1698213.1 heme ABC transporter ATP-binding protein [Rhodovibrio salinarum]
MLSARDIQVARGGRTVLTDASLDVRPGQLLAVIGPNGAGKSSLLQVLSRALAPDAGAVALDGRPLSDWHRGELARRRAVLPQAPSVAFPFRVRDVVALGRSPHAGLTDRAADQAIIEAAMRETAITHLAGRIYGTLSGGERQRVHLARVLAQVWASLDDDSACYLLLDEPTNNLDLAHQHDLLVQARRFAARGGGVLAILHDPNLAAAYADRIAIVAGGRVVMEGMPESVLSAETLTTTFGMPVEVFRPHGAARPLIFPAPPVENASTQAERDQEPCSSR